MRRLLLPLAGIVVSLALAPAAQGSQAGPLQATQTEIIGDVAVLDVRTGAVDTVGERCRGDRASKVELATPVTPDGRAVYMVAELRSTRTPSMKAVKDTRVCDAVQASAAFDEPTLVRLDRTGTVTVLGALPHVGTDYDYGLSAPYGRLLYGNESYGAAYDAATGAWGEVVPAAQLGPPLPAAMRSMSVRRFPDGSVWGFGGGRVVRARDGEVVSSRRVGSFSVRTRTVPYDSAGGGGPYICRTGDPRAVAKGVADAFVAEDGRTAWGLSAPTVRRRFVCAGQGGVPDMVSTGNAAVVDRWLLRSTDGGITWRRAARLPRGYLDETTNVSWVDGRAPVISFARGFARFNAGRFTWFPVVGRFE